MLRAEGVTVRFGRNAPPVLDRVGLAVPPASLQVVTGRSGSGKSTLQRVLAALQPAESGRVTLDGEAQPTPGDRRASRRWHRRVLLLPQDTARVFNPVLRLRSQFRACLALHEIGTAAAERDAIAADALGACGVPAGVLDRHPDGLSGGQLQRAALARLLCLQPRYLLLDEPTAALDPATALELVALLRSLQAKRGFGLVVASHDPLVARHADAVARLADGRLAPAPLTAAAPPTGRSA